jgi:thiamine pyrophosphokinase
MKKLILTLTVLLTLVSLNAQTYKYKIVSQTDSVETILTNGEVTIKFKNKYDEFGFQKATINIKTDSLTVKDVVWGIHYKSESDDFVDISLENNKEYRIG